MLSSDVVKSCFATTQDEFLGLSLAYRPLSDLIQLRVGWWVHQGYGWNKPWDRVWTESRTRTKILMRSEGSLLGTGIKT